MTASRYLEFSVQFSLSNKQINVSQNRNIRQNCSSIFCYAVLTYYILNFGAFFNRNIGCRKRTLCAPVLVWYFLVSVVYWGAGRWWKRGRNYALALSLMLIVWVNLTKPCSLPAMNLTKQLIPWRRVFRAQLKKKSFPHFCSRKVCCTAPKNPPLLPVRARWIQSMSFQPISFRSVLIFTFL